MAYFQILKSESVVLISDIAKNFFILSGRIDPVKTNAYKEWLLLENKYLERLRVIGDFAVKQNDFLALGNIVVAKIEWWYSKLYLTHTFKNINKHTFCVKSEIDKSEMKRVMELIDMVNRSFEAYKQIGDKESMVTTLFLKFELLHFACLMDDANIVAQAMLGIIEANELNGLKHRYDSLMDCGTSHERFIKKFANHVRKIYEVARNSNIMEEVLSGPISEERLAITEGNTQWTIDEFFEFDISHTGPTG